MDASVSADMAVAVVLACVLVGVVGQLVFGRLPDADGKR